MVEADWLALLCRQALLLSLGVALLWALRRPLLRLRANAVYASWLLLPALLLTPLLPRPTQEPLQLVLTATAAPGAPSLAALPGPPPNQAALWLALWLAGTAAVAAVQAGRQWRLARFGERLPAGSSPALVGLLRPRVALPADFDRRFSPAERQLILAHEQVHRERLDNLWNLLACALTALHWWNPLAWWAAHRMQADQELACDAAVLSSHPAGRLVYTQALMAAHGLQPPRAPLASRWGSSHPLVERIAMLNRPQSLPRRRAAVLGLAMLGVVGLAYAAQSEPPAATADAKQQLQKVDIRLNLTSGELKSAPRLITALGVRSRIEWGPTPEETWRLDITVTRLEDGRLQVLTLPSYAGKALGQHIGVLASGESFGHRLGGADGVPLLQMTRVVTLLPADFKMPTQESKPRS